MTMRAIQACFPSVADVGSSMISDIAVGKVAQNEQVCMLRSCGDLAEIHW
jgi:hypothetical protein